MAKGKYAEWLTEDALIKLRAWARDGLTDEQIAVKMGIGSRTLYEWRKKYPQIMQSLKKGKEVVDIEVENALLKRALGYTYNEVTHERVGGQLIPTKIIKKEMPPDTTAQIFWLKNRKPEQWSDKKDETGNIEVTVKYDYGSSDGS